MSSNNRNNNLLNYILNRLNKLSQGVGSIAFMTNSLAEDLQELALVIQNNLIPLIQSQENRIRELERELEELKKKGGDQKSASQTASSQQTKSTTT